VCPHRAKSIVVLSQTHLAPDETDAKSLRTVLSLLQIMDPRAWKCATNLPVSHQGVSPERKGEPHFVVELCDIDNAALINIVAQVQKLFRGVGFWVFTAG
jgi:hypothetical protein